MTIPFYSQEELDAALAKERLQICAEILRGPERLQIDLRPLVERISRGKYPRTLTITPMPSDDLASVRLREKQCQQVRIFADGSAGFCFKPSGHTDDEHETKNAVWPREPDDNCEPARTRGK